MSALRLRAGLAAALALTALGLTALVAIVAAGRPATQLSLRLAATSLPRPDHVVLVMFENHSYNQINGSSSAPEFNSLAAQGAKFTQSFAVTHPSQPNYLALFSGGTQGVTNDNCPQNFSTANLGRQLINAGFTFTGYSESMPSNGYTGCTSGTYARKHNAWVDFSNVPAASNLTFASFPTNYASLPAVAFVSPNLCNDMHDCSISTGDTWLSAKFDAYAQWAKTHNSLLIVTFDEDNGSSSNHIFTFFVGQHVKVGSYSEHITHYTILRTIEDAYGLAHLGNAASATPITDAWI